MRNAKFLFRLQLLLILLFVSFSVWSQPPPGGHGGGGGGFVGPIGGENLLLMFGFLFGIINFFKPLKRKK